MTKRYLFLFLTGLLFFSATKAQVSYSFSALTGTYAPITGTTPTLESPAPGPFGYSTTDEGYANGVPIGFNFVYNGTSYTAVNINANGYMTLGTSFIADPNEDYYQASLSGGPTSLPATRPIIAPFWADMDLQAETNLRYTVTGTAPNRVFVVEWASLLWDYQATAAVISVQARLYETTNVIEFTYQEESGSPSTGAVASIGLTSAATGSGSYLSLTDASGAPTASSTIDTKLTVRPATGQIYRFTPLSCLPPADLTLTNVTVTTATASWTAVTGAAGYEYAVTTTTDAPTTAGTATTGTTVNLTGLAAGVNFVWVRTNCGGGSYSLWTVKAIVPCTTNISPTNAATNVPIPATISWNTVPNATGYTIMFSLDGITYTNLGTLDNTFSSTPITGLSASTTYYWYIRPVGGSDTASESCASNAFSFTTVSGPANDNICDAIALTLNGASDCQSSETASVEANEPTFGCSTPNNTLWYTYTPSTTGVVNIVMSKSPGATTDIDAWVGLFTASGTCPSLTLTEAFPGTCDEADLTTQDSVVIASPTLTAGVTYYIMIDGFAGATGAYCIKVVDAPAGPVNDNTCSAIALTLNGSTDCQTTEYATVESNEPTFGCSTPNNTVWYTYTAITNGPVNIVMSKNLTATADLDAWVGLFTPSGTCPSLTLTEAFTGTCQEADLTTQDSVVLTTPALVAGTTYYIMIDGFAGAVGGFCIRVADAPPPPANDDCSGAVDLSGGTITPGTTIGATQTLPANACNGFTGDANDDVWYSVTVSNAGDLTVSEVPDTNLDAVLEAFTGTCGSLTSIGCADAGVDGDPETLNLTGLTPGQVIYIRVYDYNGVGTESSFTMIASGTALPVKLANFRGERVGATNKLTWTTASEQNNHGFELQRSIDGESFGTLSFVASKATDGSSNSPLNYQYTDEKPLAGNNYYRLKQVDKDGKVNYSNVVMIKGVHANSITLSAVYPNPVKQSLRMLLTAPATAKVKVIVSDMAGKVVAQQNTLITAGDNNLTMDVASLPSGSYMIKVVCDNGCETTVSKFVKQ